MKYIVFIVFTIFNCSKIYAQSVSKYDTLLLSKLKSNDSESGFYIIIETISNKIFSQSEFRKEGNMFIKDSSLITKPFEVGDLFLPISLTTLISKKYININDSINIESGYITLNNQKIFDFQNRGLSKLTYKEIISYPSNVGIAKSVYKFYKNKSDSFLNYTQSLIGGTKVKKVKSNLIKWAYGYDIKLTPQQLLYFYNSVAQKKEPWSKEINECLVDVCKNGTAREFLRNVDVAGKTGTIKNSINKYTSAFIGYFPLNNPVYTILIVINNSKKSPKFYGADVAGSLVKDFISIVR